MELQLGQTVRLRYGRLDWTVTHIDEASGLVSIERYTNDGRHLFRHFTRGQIAAGIALKPRKGGK